MSTEKKFNPIGYAMSAVNRLPILWNDKEVNRNAMRAEFRRWRPTSDGKPRMAMCSYLWSFVRPPAFEKLDSETEEEYDKRRGLIDSAIEKAAVIVSLRAVAGEKEGPPVPLGSALFNAGISDSRFARLMTTPKSGRLEALRRSLQVVEKSGAVIDWGKETGRIYYFLFGSDESAKKSQDYWASDFFRSRGKTQKDADKGQDSNDKTD